MNEPFVDMFPTPRRKAGEENNDNYICVKYFTVGRGGFT